MAGALGPRGLQIREAGPCAGIVTLPAEPGAQVEEGIRRFSVGPAAGVTFNERCRRLSECAGVDPLRDRLDPPVTIELHRQANATSAGRRTNLRASVLALQLARVGQRGGEPQDLRRIER